MGTFRKPPSSTKVFTTTQALRGWTAYGLVNAGAIVALRSGAGATPVGLVFVATAGAMDVDAWPKPMKNARSRFVTD